MSSKTAGSSSKRKRRPQEHGEEEEELIESQKENQRADVYEQLIWFQLMDAVTGQPFKDTIPYWVSLAPSANVLEFLEEVKDEDKKDGTLLTGIAATQLRAYKNKASFDKRNAAVRMEKKSPSKKTRLSMALGCPKKTLSLWLSRRN